jgi:hypothetical protein
MRLSEILSRTSPVPTMPKITAIILGLSALRAAFAQVPAYPACAVPALNML